MYIAGTPDEVVGQIAVWRDHGLRCVVLVNGGGVQRRLRKGMTSVVPFGKVLRELKRLSRTRAA